MQELADRQGRPSTVQLLYEVLAECDDTGVPGSELTFGPVDPSTLRPAVLRFALRQGLVHESEGDRIRLTSEGQVVLDHLCEVADLLYQLEDAPREEGRAAGAATGSITAADLPGEDEVLVQSRNHVTA